MKKATKPAKKAAPKKAAKPAAKKTTAKKATKPAKKAAAKKINAETDILDKDFVKDITGVNSMEKDKDKEHEMIKKIEELNSKERIEYAKNIAKEYANSGSKS